MYGTTCGQCSAPLGGVHSSCWQCDVKLCAPRDSPACTGAHYPHPAGQLWRIDEARGYVRRIRNTAKKAYAREVFRALCTGHHVPERSAGLSAMAGQAVAAELVRIMSATPPGAPGVPADPAPEFILNGVRHRYAPTPDDKYPTLRNAGCSCGWHRAGYVREWLALANWETHRAELGPAATLAEVR